MNQRGKIIGFIFSLLFILILLIKPRLIINSKKIKEIKLIHQSEIKLIKNYDLENSIRISYIGDLINIISKKIKFEEIFQKLSYYLKESELSIGVLKSLSPNFNHIYTSNNNIPFFLNYSEYNVFIRKEKKGIYLLKNYNKIDKFTLNQHKYIFL